MDSSEMVVVTLADDWTTFSKPETVLEVRLTVNFSPLSASISSTKAAEKTSPMLTVVFDGVKSAVEAVPGVKVTEAVPVAEI